MTDEVREIITARLDSIHGLESADRDGEVWQRRAGGWTCAERRGGTVDQPWSTLRSICEPSTFLVRAADQRAQHQGPCGSGSTLQEDLDERHRDEHLDGTCAWVGNNPTNMEGIR